MWYLKDHINATLHSNHYRCRHLQDLEIIFVLLRYLLNQNQLHTLKLLHHQYHLHQRKDEKMYSA